MDDSVTEARAARATLEPYFACEIIGSAATALERIAANDVPDVLLLDWEMPDMSGVEVCRFVRTTRDELALPVLLLTSRTEREDLVEALAAGANDFITKPYHPAALLARMRSAARLQALHRLGTERAAFERQLIGIVSHDLRNPLSTILLGTQLLMSGDRVAESGLRSLARIQTAAERGARMINDLLDFTQARVGGGIAISPAAGNLHAVVRQAVEEAAVGAPERAIDVSTSGDGHGAWDVDRMSQVVHNLVSNALKYGAPSSAIVISCLGDADRVAVTIHNAGTPIDDEAMTRIFQPMQRATSQLENRARSVGLGLFIVKHIIEAHGGQIAVTSTADAGTTFSFWVPKRLAAR